MQTLFSFRAKAAQRFQGCIDLCGRGVAADSSRIGLCADARCARVDHHRICGGAGAWFRRGAALISAAWPG